MYVRPGPGATPAGAGVRFQLQARITASGSQSFVTIGMVDFASDADLTEWKQVSGSLTVPSDADEVRVYVQATDATIDFEVDHAFLVDADENAVDNGDELINNGDFEQGNVGWNTLSESFSLHSSGSPSGLIHAQMSSRTNTENGFKQDIDMSKLD